MSRTEVKCPARRAHLSAFIYQQFSPIRVACAILTTPRMSPLQGWRMEKKKLSPPFSLFPSQMYPSDALRYEILADHLTLQQRDIHNNVGYCTVRVFLKEGFSMDTEYLAIGSRQVPDSARASRNPRRSTLLRPEGKQQ